MDISFIELGIGVSRRDCCCHTPAQVQPNTCQCASRSMLAKHGPHSVWGQDETILGGTQSLTVTSWDGYVSDTYPWLIRNCVVSEKRRGPRRTQAAGERHRVFGRASVGIGAFAARMPVNLGCRARWACPGLVDTGRQVIGLPGEATLARASPPGIGTWRPDCPWRCFDCCTFLGLARPCRHSDPREVRAHWRLWMSCRDICMLFARIGRPFCRE
jgi:hypothetical protein